MEEIETTTGTRRGFWLTVLGIAGAAVLLTLWIKATLPQPHSGLPAGETVPLLEAGGWLQGNAPPQTPSRGMIRVIHAWFTDCPACYREAPRLVALEETFREKGVEFVGLTPDPKVRLKDIQRYLEKTEITWVNGYGASETLIQFGVEYFPSVWIVDSEGTILWNLDSEIPLEKAIPLALEGKLPLPSGE